MQSRDTIEGIGGCAVLIVAIAAFFISGSMSYNIVNPHSFLGVLVFLVVWAIVHFIVRMALTFLLGIVIVFLSR